jgi:transposase
MEGAVMNVIHARCCGVDVHKRSVTACVVLARPGEPPSKEVRTFETMTDDLLRLGDWLAERGVTHVAMESTGVYWKPLWNLLEAAFTLLLVNPAHMKAVPGRKTDVKDAEWIADLLQHGLLQGSFVPKRPERELRELTRYRSTLVRERSAEVNRLQKTLEGANIKLGSVVSDVTGVSARAILDALVDGQTEIADLTDLAVGKLRAKRDRLARALTGRLSAHQRFMITQHLTMIDTLDAQIDLLSEEIAQRLAPFQGMLTALDTIPGIGPWSAQIILAEIGTEMDRFPTAGHLSSWAGMCPGHHESAGKQRSSRIRKGSPWLRAILTGAAHAAGRTEGTYLSACYRRLIARRGKQKAAIAVGRMILEQCYHVLATGEPYDDARLRRPATISPEARLVRQLERLGHRVILTPAA